MKKRLKLTSAVAAGICLAAVGVAADDSTFTLTYKAQDILGWDDPILGRWASPSVFGARFMEKGARFSAGYYYSAFEGRTLEAREAILSVVPDEKLLVWFSKQDYLAKGRSGNSRFRVEADTYGFRYLVIAPDDRGYNGTAIQIEAFRPGTASLRAGGNSADYFATKNVAFSAMHSDIRNDYVLGYTSVRGAASGKGDVVEFAIGKTIDLGERVKGRLEGHIVGQSLKGNGFNINFELRPVIYGALAYSPAQWLTVEGDLSVMPMGMPIAGGRLTPMTSFQIYNPGGPVEGLRKKFVGVGSLRMFAHWKF